MTYGETNSPLLANNCKNMLQGLKKFACKPLSAKRKAEPTTSKTLRDAPKLTTKTLSNHIKLFLWGFLIDTHMKHGYLDVTSKPTAPIRTTRYVKNENPTVIKKPTEPNNTRNIIRTKEQGFCVLVMYTISKLSHDDIEYIGYEHKQQKINVRCIKQAACFEQSCS